MFRLVRNRLQAIHGLFYRSVSSTYEMLAHKAVWDHMCANISYVLDTDFLEVETCSHARVFIIKLFELCVD
jgi:hypothetical protein